MLIRAGGGNGFGSSTGDAGNSGGSVGGVTTGDTANGICRAAVDAALSPVDAAAGSPDPDDESAGGWTTGISRVIRRGKMVTTSREGSKGSGGGRSGLSSPEASARSRPSEPIIRSPESSRRIGSGTPVLGELARRLGLRSS
jgi:hypothetical protein